MKKRSSVWNEGVFAHWIFAALIVLFASYGLRSQDRIKDLENRLQVMAVDAPGLEGTVELTASKLSLQEFIRNIANLNNLNIHIDPGVQGTITNNFSDVTAMEALLFLCREYNLDLEATGSILSIFPYKPPAGESKRKTPDIRVDQSDKSIEVDLQGDTLYYVAKELTRLTGTNIVVGPEVRNKPVTAFLSGATLKELLEELGYANDLDITDKGDFFLVQALENQSQQPSQAQRRTGARQAAAGNFYFQANQQGLIDLEATGAPVRDIITQVSHDLGIDYFILSDITETTTVNISGATYTELLSNILKGTGQSFTLENGIYLIGGRQVENIRQTRMLHLENRSVDKITECIPSNMLNEVNIHEMLELNSLIISGSAPVIAEIENFVKGIDRVIPVIAIEVIIVNYKKGFTTTTGVEAGLTNEPVETSGTLLPIDITLSSTSINNILSSFNGLGSINLGRVSPNFYVSLKALETQGVVKVRSTPKLSTLNGHEANMTIGNTEYYLEERSQIFANQTTTQEKIRQFKPVNADFKLTILPVVSGDDQITLDITVEQSDFTGTKLAPDAPPDQVNRSFSSKIRIRNQEMILLGGLEDKTLEDSGSGVPFLSRVPVLKWFFSNRKRAQSENKLNIFIKPTVIY
ncbi:MAG: hypothetical protein JXA03_10540 [Bacteroidales bacterium]|nr:hypothetical protein [Bacteroidales bacterium]